jgi:hypothetical protein
MHSCGPQVVSANVTPSGGMGKACAAPSDATITRSAAFSELPATGSPVARATTWAHVSELTKPAETFCGTARDGPGSAVGDVLDAPVLSAGRPAGSAVVPPAAAGGDRGRPPPRAGAGADENSRACVHSVANRAGEEFCREAVVPPVCGTFRVENERPYGSADFKITSVRLERMRGWPRPAGAESP